MRYSKIKDLATFTTVQSIFDASTNVNKIKQISWVNSGNFWHLYRVFKNSKWRNGRPGGACFNSDMCSRNEYEHREGREIMKSHENVSRRRPGSITENSGSGDGLAGKQVQGRWNSSRPPALGHLFKAQGA